MSDPPPAQAPAPRQTHIDVNASARAIESGGTLTGARIEQAAADVINISVGGQAQKSPAIPLDQALGRLAALPLDHLPDHAPLPRGSRMPFSRNPQFTGRVGDLLALAAALKAGDTAAIGQVAAATGLGGIGKTQLAAEFVHRYGQFFPGGVFWMSFADAAGASAEIAACGGGAYMALFADAAGLTLEQQCRAVLAEWSGPLPRLLVFDNCEDEQLLARWRPTVGCRVLVTSRRPAWDEALGVRALPLGVLPRAESVALLGKFLAETTKDEGRRTKDNEQPPKPSTATQTPLNAIAAELGDLPLALHLAGSYLKNNRHDIAPAEYLAELRSAELLKHPSLEGEDLTYSATNHVLHIGRTFALSYDQLDAAKAVDGMALALLARAAYFAPGEPIPRDLLRATLGDDTDKRQFGRALRRLINLGLIEEESDGAARLHRLLAAFVRGLQRDVEARTAVEEAMLDTFSDLNKAGIPAPLLVLQSHLRAVTEAALRRNDELAANLCNEMGYYLANVLADYEAVQPYYERSLEINQIVFGDHHSNTLTSLNNIGALLTIMGDLANARVYFERVLEIKQTVLGDRHPETALSLSNMGGLLRAVGDLAGARSYYEQALDIRREVLGERHPHTALSLSNLGELLSVMGDTEAALLYCEQALDIRREVLGERHPQTAHSLNNLGALLRKLDDMEGARVHYQKALDILRAVLGERHPDTATSLNNLGMLLRNMGDLEGARRYYEQALHIKREVLGVRHPNTALSLNNLAVLCFDEGKFQEAAALMHEALSICEQVLGSEHPDTQSSRASLATIEARLAQDR